MGNGQKTRHHIRPTSKGGSTNGDNVSWIGKKLHDKYHSLFSNRTPEEIIDFLVNYFWKGKIEYVEKYLLKKGGVMKETKRYCRCPHCYRWDNHKILGGTFRYLELKCNHCQRIFVEA